MKLHLSLELDTSDENPVHPRIAGALVDYANAVVSNNQTVMRWKDPNKQPGLIGEPPVGLASNGVMETEQGVTIREAVEH